MNEQEFYLHQLSQQLYSKSLQVIQLLQESLKKIPKNSLAGNDLARKQEMEKQLEKEKKMCEIYKAKRDEIEDKYFPITE